MDLFALDWQIPGCWRPNAPKEPFLCRFEPGIDLAVWNSPSKN